MLIGYFTPYKNFTGNIKYDAEDNIYYGSLIDIKDFVNYHANNIVDLQKHYMDAVDYYLDIKNQIDKGSDN